MPPLKSLTPAYAVSSTLGREEFAALRALGFSTVINFRPDNECANQLSDSDARCAAEAEGLAYVHVPVNKFDVFAEEIVTKMVSILHTSPAPVLAYCATGQRAAIIWAAAAARALPVESVLGILQSAGFDLGFLRDDLDAQAGRKLWDDSADAPPTVGTARVAA